MRRGRVGEEDNREIGKEKEEREREEREWEERGKE